MNGVPSAEMTGFLDRLQPTARAQASFPVSLDRWDLIREFSFFFSFIFYTMGVYVRVCVCLPPSFAE